MKGTFVQELRVQNQISSNLVGAKLVFLISVGAAAPTTPTLTTTLKYELRLISKNIHL